ncbi:MAG: ABC-F family ATP-binding cassette domain-containing protein [Candidatus Peregrinibacteria bacterium]|nr:ABC-F family ATP-binding cassette domain-containing protein [Candidatus Peregrinibacteria bacterium]MDZ4244652.1 ABC-F family ATP-binding cassette domain-containing protein [Candidatus Gracilibacteria bacterium]
MFTISGLNKSYGTQILFQDVDLNIAPKEKIGLIGRNGSGKSTFLKILLGEESYLEGSIEMPRGYRIRALEQHMLFSEKTILAQVCKALPLNATNEEWKAKSILMGLGFDEMDFERAPSEFSSGFQVRVRLAEALVSESDLLLLDEPTNYLDILSLRWLERFLKSWNGAFVLVTHDRNFMDLVVSHTVAIHRGHMRKMSGGPMKLLEHIRKDEEIYDKTRKNQEKKREQEAEFIRKFRAGARSAGLVQSRIKSLAKQEIKEKLENIPTIRFHFRSIPCKSDAVIQASNISFGYTIENQLIKDFSLTTFPGDRIAIIGRNGKGKSTLLRLLHQTLEPDSGKVRLPPTLAVEYFGIDSIQALHASKTILQELLAIPGTSEQEARNLCGTLLFRGDDVKKQISMISGGEKSRVCLGKTLLSASQLLMLDEPTNHLDMESVEALAEAIENYEGTVIFVTHNEAILSRLATKLVLFDNDEIKVLDYGYDKFLRLGGWSDDEAVFKTGTEKNSQYKDGKERAKRQRSLKRDIEKIEKEISKLDVKKVELGHSLQQACVKKHITSIKEYGLKIKEIEDQIDSKYEAMEVLINEVDC